MNSQLHENFCRTMNSHILGDDDCVSFKDNRKTAKHSRERNYAPIVIPETSSETRTTNVLFASRQAEAKRAYNSREKQRMLLRQKANALPTYVSQKQVNRIQYHKRKAAEAEQYKTVVARPSGLSPYLDFKQNTNLSIDKRVQIYNIRHKTSCCKRKFTDYEIRSSIRLDGSREPVYLHLKCHCATERITGIHTAVGCMNCTQSSTFQVDDPSFPGTIYYCKFCRTTMYRTIGFSFIRPRIHTVKTVLAPLPLVNAWLTPAENQANVVPPIVNIDAEEHHILAEFEVKPQENKLETTCPSTSWTRRLSDFRVYQRRKILEIVSPRQAPTSAIDVFPRLEVRTFRERVQAQAGFTDLLSPVLRTWDSFVALLKKTKEWAIEMVLDSVVRVAKLRAWKTIIDFFDTVKNAVLEKPMSTALLFVRLMTTDSNVERIMSLLSLAETVGCPNLLITIIEVFELPSLESFLFPTHNGEGVQAQSGSLPAFLSTLFLIPKTRGGGHIFELVKIFNTMTSGWKNLHELVANFIQYIPTWALKLFTISDPRKRFGVDAKTPGNPIFNMMQAYLQLLRGENCASPAAYEIFQTSWKASDEYITTDYPPNESVIRLHKHYYVNANAIMKPGTYGNKPIPFVITLYGPPGTGKSTTWPLLVSGIVPGSVEQIRSLSYTRNTVSDYFDGYCPEKHKIFLYDDFGSQIDDEGANELMAIVSNADYLPPYASMSDPNVGIKGTSFASPIVILNSNFKTFEHCKQVADKPALTRRLGYVITWSERFAPDNRYELHQARPDGKLYPVYRLTSDTDYRWTVKELQLFFRIKYDEHMREQTAVNDEFNRYLAVDTPTTWLQTYDEVRTHNRVQVQSGEIFYDARTETIKNLDAVLYEMRNDKTTARSFGFMAVVDLTRRMADYVTPVLKSFLVGVGIFAAAFATSVFLFRLLRPAQSVANSGQTATRAERPAGIFHRPNMQPMRAQVQSGCLNEQGTMMRILSNHVVLVNDDGKFVNGMFVSGRILLTVKHFATTSGQVHIHSPRSDDTKLHIVNLRECKIVPIRDVDLALVEMPIQVAPYKNLMSSFASRPQLRGTKGYTSRRMIDGTMMLYEVDIVPGSFHLECYDDEATSKYLFSGISELRYNFRGAAGDCGNLLMCQMDGSIKVVGMHNSGNPVTGVSFANMLNRHELETYMLEFTRESRISRSDVHEYEAVEIQNGICGVNKTEAIYVSKVPIGSSGKTSIIPSTIQGVLQEPVTQPAMLQKRRGIDPMAKAISKYGLNTDQFPDWVMDEAVQSLAEQLASLKTDEDRVDLYSIHECLNGVPGEVESVDLSTSSGYPFSLNHKLRGAKRKVIDGEPGSLVLGKEAKLHYAQWENDLQRDVIPSDPFLVTLKDERRKVEKVLLGKTRAFCASSITAYVFNKMYFGAFLTFFKRIREGPISTVGFNRGSVEWHRMITYLKEVGEYGLDGDQENWDGNFKAGLAMRCLLIFQMYYGEGPETEAFYRRYVLFSHAIFAILRVTWDFEHEKGLAPYCAIFLQVHGVMPSGWLLTLVMNSLVNALLFRMAWILLVSKPFNDLYYFRRYTREKYTGDDNLLSVAEQFLPEFNNVTISIEFAKYGQTYTSATKDGTLVEYKRIVDCTFLKTKTGVAYDRFIPLFDMEANLETANWIRQCDDEHVATEDNCNDVLRNLFFYGREVFERYRTLMLVKPFNLISFYALEQAYLGYGSIPDPTGAFGFSRNATRDPTNFYKAIEKSKALLKSAPETVHLQGGLNFWGYWTTRFAQPKMNPLTQNINVDLSAAMRRAGIIPIMPTGKQLQELYAQQLNLVSAHVSHNDSVCVCTMCGYNHKNSRESLAVAMQTYAPGWLDTQKVQAQSGSTNQPVNMGSTQPAIEQGPDSNLDESNPQVTERMGVHLSEQQKLVVKKGVDGNAIATISRFNAHLNEPDWDLQKMLVRENLVSAFNWSLTDNVGEDLAILPAETNGLDVPSDLLQNAIVSAPFNRFQWWRCDKVIVRFQLVASRAHQGRLMVYFHPSMMAKRFFDDDHIFGLTRASSMQCAYLDPANGTVVDLEIPFVFNKGFVDLVRHDSLGQIHCKVLNKLQCGTGASTSVEVKVFVSFENSRFRVPKPGDETFLSTLKKEAEALGFAVVAKPQKQRVQLQSGPMSAIGGKLDKLLEDVLPAEIIGAAGGILLDKPAVTEYPPPLVHKDAQYMSASRGVENLERMTLEPSAQYITDDQFGSGVDEMDLKYLLKKPMFYGSFNWSGTRNVGDILFADTISPTHLVGYNQEAGGAFEPTMLGFLSDQFTYWRGSINLTFQIAGTGFHEGRLDFCNHPAQQVAPATYNSAMSQYVNSQTIRNTDNTVEVRVPFHSDTPWKRVWRGGLLVEDSTSSVGQRFMDYCVGTFTVRVAVPLKNPSFVTSNVDVNIFISAGDDFELHTLSVFGGRWNIETINPPSFERRKAIEDARSKERVQAQAGDINVDTKDDKGVIPLSVGDAYTYDMPVQHFGESYRNLREMCKRYQQCHIQPTGILTAVLTTNISNYTYDMQRGGGMIGLCANMFRLFRGPLNFKAQLFAQNVSGTNRYNADTTAFVTHIPQPPTNMAGLQASMTQVMGWRNGSTSAPNEFRQPPLVRFSTRQVGEFQIPLQTIYHSAIVQKPYDAEYPAPVPYFLAAYNTQFSFIVGVENPLTADNTLNTTYTMAVAFGDETRFGAFVGIGPVFKSAIPKWPNA